MQIANSRTAQKQMSLERALALLKAKWRTCLVGFVAIAIIALALTYIYRYYGPTSDHAVDDFLSAMRTGNLNAQYDLLDQAPSTRMPSGGMSVPGHAAPPTKQQFLAFFGRSKQEWFPTDPQIEVVSIDRTYWFGLQNVFIVKIVSATGWPPDAKRPPITFVISANRTADGWTVDGESTYRSYVDEAFGKNSQHSAAFLSFWPFPKAEPPKTPRDFDQ